MGLAEKLKLAPLKCSDWFLFYWNIFFNIILTVVVILLQVPYAIELGVRDIGAQGRDAQYATEQLLYNDPWAFVFTVPTMVIGVMICMFRFSKFMRVVSVMEIFAAWIQFSLALLTTMQITRRVFLEIMFDEAGQVRGQLTFPRMYLTTYVSAISAVIMFIQAAGMAFSSAATSVVTVRKIQERFDKTKTNLELNRDAKIGAIAFHAIAIVINLGFITYCSFHFGVYNMIKKKIAYTYGFGEVPMYVIFMLFAFFSLFADIAGLTAFVLSFVFSVTNNVIPAVFAVLHVLIATFESLFFFGVVCAITVYAYVVTVGKTDYSPIALNFYDGLYAIGVLAAWRMVMFVNNIIVVLANIRLKKSGDAAIGEGGDIAKLRKTLGIGKGKKRGSSTEL